MKELAIQFAGMNGVMNIVVDDMIASRIRMKVGTDCHETVEMKDVWIVAPGKSVVRSDVDFDISMKQVACIATRDFTGELE